ncbi:pyridoxamine 5'-phosphate oxidase family protein [Amycolatopsis acidicola]|uniref:Pyridoxamine 5'-phosphate oxidase family protein n=1 Tax=Amycolatopsis acidicola TaxID=2596893 RepID=A0A5N0UXK8_9PSEU|nr:pyridoxamine 5'-phosphate oxidase family protein [Amycolatopsis acidicola]KAA9158234.1 pyridoxamine 5'-phosphate oxidase family protein [Amycolatopsis acidicola]
MANWQEFSTQAPDLAREVRARFEAHATHVLATLRRDGSPRVSGIEVDYAGAELMAGSMLDARKARDLLRDGRFALHAHPGPAGDAKISGVAVEVTDQAEIEAVQGDSSPCNLFRLELREAVLTSVEGTTLVAESWRADGRLIRFERPENGPVVRIER